MLNLWNNWSLFHFIFAIVILFSLIRLPLVEIPRKIQLND